jgi:hypothetical protein
MERSGRSEGWACPEDGAITTDLAEDGVAAAPASGRTIMVVSPRARLLVMEAGL